MEISSEVGLYEAFKTDVIGFLEAIVSLEDENKRVELFFKDTKRRRLIGDFVIKITGLRSGMTSTEKLFHKFRKHLDKPEYVTNIRSRNDQYFINSEATILGLVDKPFLVQTVKTLWKDHMTPEEKTVIWEYLNAFLDMFTHYDTLNRGK